MLGTREPEIYGAQTLDDLNRYCETSASDLGLLIECHQSNLEGELAEHIQQAREEFDGIIINAGGYTHSSVAIHDALKMCGLPIIEVHISNIYAREEFRHTSLISPLAKGVLCGFGIMGYSLALQAIKEMLDSRED